MHTTRDTCRICRQPLKSVVDFGVLALTSQFPLRGQNAHRAPLHLMQCTVCNLLQLEHTVDPALMYTDGYGYASGVNEQMVAHLTDLVDFVAARYGIRPDDSVLDIACNDGTLLRAWQPYQVSRWGVDPIAAQVPGCHVVRDYFRPGWFKGFQVITSVAVLYDLEDPITFAQGVADALADNGVWVCEVQYAGEIFDGKWDQICHEHLCYYGLGHLMHLASYAGLYFDYAEVNPSNGGSLRACFTKRPSQRPVRGFGLVRDEDRWDVSKLPGMIVRSAAAIRVAVQSERPVRVLGASTKGNVILQVAGLSNKDIEQAHDLNPVKIGRFTPGSGIQIIPARETLMPKDVTYLVLPYHFRRSILKRHGPGRYIFPLPNVSIVCV